VGKVRSEFVEPSPQGKKKVGGENETGAGWERQKGVSRKKRVVGRAVNLVAASVIR